MFIVVNKNFTLANITPSTVYQGSNLANELAIFAPFSISSYSAVKIAFMLPSGEYLPPSLAFPSAEQPDGFGAWSMLLPASVTAIPGTVRLSLSFIGANNAKMVAEAAEFTVNASVPSVPPDTPSQDIYEQILSYVSEVLNRKPNWLQTNPNADDYIANKPPLTPMENGAEVIGNLSVTGNASIGGEMSVDGVSFSDKLDKASAPSGETSIYAVSGEEQKTIPATQFAQTSGAIPLYSENKTLRTENPSYELDAVNLQYLNEQLRNKVLPNWVINLSNVTTDTRSIPPTSSAVIRYASPAIVGDVSGAALMIDDFSSISGQTPIKVTAPNNVSAVTVYGKNIADSSAAGKASVSYTGSVVGNTDGSVDWSAGSNGAIKIPVKIPAGVTFTYSFDWVSNNASDALGNIRFADANGTVISTVSSLEKATLTNGEDSPEIATMFIYKTNVTTALVSAARVENLCINLGTLATYTPYSAPVERSINSSGSIQFSPPFADGVTIIPNVPATISVTYTRDSTKVINRIFELISEIQEVIAT